MAAPGAVCIQRYHHGPGRNAACKASAALPDAGRVRTAELDLVAYADIRESDAVAEAMKDYVKCYKNHIKLGGYKMFLDGSPQGRTAWMREPYEQVEGWDQPADIKGTARSLMRRYWPAS